MVLVKKKHKVNKHNANKLVKEEFIIDSRSVSQLINFKSAIFLLFSIVSIFVLSHVEPVFVPIAIIFTVIRAILLAIKIINTHFTVFKLTNQRLIISQGWFKKTVFEIELYRIKEIELQQNILMRIFNLGNVLVHSSMKTKSMFSLSFINDPLLLRNVLRNEVNKSRKQFNVREFDSY